MSNTTKVRIFVIDDHRMFADGLVELLSSEPDFEIVGHASSVAESKRALLSAVSGVDVILLDVQLTDGDGYLVHDWIVKLCGSEAPKILYVTGDDRLVAINRAMSLGAMAYLDKTGGWEEVSGAIRRAVDGSKTLGANVAAKLAEYSFGPDRTEQRLSVRETEILNGISKGLTAKEMAAQLGLALPTVRTYVSRLFKKLGAKDRAHAVSMGHAQGLLDS